MREICTITMGPLNETETFKRSGPWWDYVYDLSSVPPAGWAELFAEVWAGAQYQPKRHARIEDNRLVTICLPAELEGEHGQFLVAAIERTNTAWQEQES